MFEEGFLDEKVKKFLIIGVVLILVLVLIFILIKTFTRKKRGGSITPPEEVEINWRGPESIKIKENVFIKLIKIENYELENIETPKGFKLLSLEVEVENKSNELIFPEQFFNWLIISNDDKAFSQITWPPTPSIPINPYVRKPILLNQNLTPNGTDKGFVSFKIPDDINVEKVIFQNLEKKIVFEIPPS